MMSAGPGAENPTTGVPQAIASSITRPKVSVSDGNTNTSADEKQAARSSPAR